MKRHPPSLLIRVSPSSDRSRHSCDSTIRPPTQHAHALHAEPHTHTHTHTLPPYHIHCQACLPSHTSPAWIHLNTPHAHVAEAAALWEADPPTAADQSMSSFSQWGENHPCWHSGTKAGTWETSEQTY